jgi:uroporphyrin-III C-methyltransferase/precorrin-2 dehydrogenase/sirohydrochlorin ferrochelatase
LVGHAHELIVPIPEVSADPMQTLPIFARLDGRRCLVAGAGAVAARRVDQLLQAGAEVAVVAPDFIEALRDLANKGRIEAIDGPFERRMIDDCWLVVAATDCDEVNREVAGACEAARILCNVVDQPALCTFIMPAIIDRDPITIAISSRGQTPVLARWIKGLIEEALPNRIGALAALAGRWRDRVRAVLPDIDGRQRFWQDMFHGDVAEHAFAGRETESEAALEAALERRLDEAADQPASGQAYLVGAGPGDPELITLRGKKLLGRADAVLYDRLVNPEILRFARRDAELIPVGKTAGKPSIRQEQLNRLLVNLVASGKHVCRLKGGDPMIFGRVGEELEALTEAGLPFQIVPGVSAVSGCAAYAGIPLTMRDEARAVLIATGHTSDHSAGNLEAFRPDQTLALYMGIANFAAIAETLIERGAGKDMPLAVIENGTSRSQRVIRATLGELPELAARHGIQSPALLLIGETVRYASRFSWFNSRIPDSGGNGQLASAI